jgi:hypothetical protein
MRERRRGSHLDALVDVGVNGGVEPREGVVAGDVGAVELVDVVLVVLLADRVNARQDVDDRHPHAPRSTPCCRRKRTRDEDQGATPQAASQPKRNSTR